MKIFIVIPLFILSVGYNPIAFCQHENQITTQETKQLHTSHNVEIRISILCIEGQKYIHELTYKSGVFSTNLVQQAYGNNQCYHRADKSIQVP